MRQPKRLAPGFAEQQGILHPPQTTRLWRGFVGLSDRSLFPALFFCFAKKNRGGFMDLWPAPILEETARRIQKPTPLFPMEKVRVNF